MVKKVYLIHGWDGNSSSEPWFQWLKTELPKKNIEIITFDMPNTSEPKIEEWVGYLRKKIDEPFKHAKKLIHTIRGFGYVIRT